MNKTRWTNVVNLSGLYYKNPIKCVQKSGGGFWDKTGNLDAAILGTSGRGGMIQYTSEDKRDVELWTSGAQAVMSLLREWAHE